MYFYSQEGGVNMEFGEVKPGVAYRARNAVYAVIFNKMKDRVAVMVQNGKGFLPGGGMKDSEKKQFCLMRECIEETGFSLNIGHYIGHAQQYFQTSNNEYFVNKGYFYTGIFGDYVKLPVEDDHELVWMDLNEAKRWLFHQSHSWAVEAAFVKEKS
jgi:8-oxo-dGTP diphosphatase